MLTRPSYSRRQRHSRSRDYLQPQALILAQRRAVLHARAADDQDVRLTQKLRTTRLADGLRPTILFEIGHVVDSLQKIDMKRALSSSRFDAGVARDHAQRTRAMLSIFF
jgi:hypothetical protein